MFWIWNHSESLLLWYFISEAKKILNGGNFQVLDEEEYLQLQEGEWEVEVDEAALVGGEEAAEAAAMVDAGVLAADDPLAID